MMNIIGQNLESLILRNSCGTLPNSILIILYFTYTYTLSEKNKEFSLI